MANAKKPPRGTAKVVLVCSHQTGKKTDMQRDRQHDALKPGMRVSRNGKKYFENRKNRSDVHGRRQHKFR